ncbi:MAG: hypothetical protein RIE84_00845 [Parvibaculum sp.]|uniref:hypothetical protein n=1 Tax=Parvibaculum sp. TaxID=2024848 RepID=UPI0032EB1011
MMERVFLRLKAILAGAALLAAAGQISAAEAAPPDNSHNPALPQFNVVGTDVMLHSSVYAEEASKAVADARRANAECSEMLFQQSVAWVDKNQYDALSRQGGATPYILADTYGQDTAALKKLAAEMRSEWAARCGEKSEARADTNSYAAGAGIHWGRIKLPTLSYLGFEDALTLAQTIGVVDGEDEGGVAGASIGGEGFVPDWNLWWSANLTRSSTNVSSFNATIDPMGDGLLIPGPLGGASGFALPSAGGLNVVNNAEFDGNYDWLDFHAKFGMPFECGAQVFMPFFGIGLTRGDTDARFSGSIPGYARDFEYNTGIRVDTFSFLAGTNVVHKFKGGNLHAGGLLSLDLNDAEGTDRLSFTGFPDSRAALDNDDTTVGGRVWAGATFGAAESPFKLSVDVAWIHAANVPTVTRDGTNPSRLNLDSADAIVGALRASFRF